MKRPAALNFSFCSVALVLALLTTGCKAAPPVPASPATSATPAVPAVQPVAAVADPAPLPDDSESAANQAQPAVSGLDHISGDQVMKLTEQFLAVAPKRYVGSPGHAAAEKFIRDHFAPEAVRGNYIDDTFTANTPVGPLTMHNLLVKFPSSNPAKKDGIIVLASHYETNYPLKDVNFVGANDGACTSALLIAIGQYFRAHPPQGYSIWLLFDDGEEAVANPPYTTNQWSASNSLYGTRHIAAKWSGDGTLSKIKAVLIADMIGDKDLNIDRVDNSTPWLLDMLRTAARDTNHTASIFKYNEVEDDDHLPFVARGVPALDMLDAHYGPITPDLFDGYHHTPQDTIDKISAHSLQISSDLILEMIKLIDQR